MIKRKLLLLDTCFLIQANRYLYLKKNKRFQNFVDLLRKNGYVLVITDFIRFEFMRGCKIEKHRKEKLDFLHGLIHEKSKLLVDINIIDEAEKIANIYSNKNINTKQISMVDCINSALLRKYKGSLELVTLDHKDYPLVANKRKKIEVVDVAEDILVFGFYGW